MDRSSDVGHTAEPVRRDDGDGSVPVVRDLDDAVARAAALVRPGRRTVLGLAGEPGAGKSTVAAHLVRALAPDAVLVPMDGFHLAGEELRRLRRDGRKGAPDTFDVAGYVHLLGRLRARTDPVVYAPAFHRDIEEAVAGEIPVPADVPLVVTEGNYLLLDLALDVGPWAAVRPLLDACWSVQVPPELRVERLVARHVAFGRSPGDARTWALGSDQCNADLVAAAADRADLVLRLD